MELFNDPEQEQFERNKDAMRARAREIPGEIKRETEAIRARFADPQARMFPVAVTFLVPEKSGQVSMITVYLDTNVIDYIAMRATSALEEDVSSRRRSEFSSTV